MNEPTTQPYPRGEDDRSYALVFQVWIIMFLGIICVGLLNYIALWWRSR